MGGHHQIWGGLANLPWGLNLYLRLNNTTPAESFLKGCTWVCRPFSKLFWNKQKQTRRQLESKKQNNMHYSWPDGIQRLLEEIDNLTHIFSSVSNSNSWQKLKISRWGSGLVLYAYVCVCVCLSVCCWESVRIHSLASIACRCAHVCT